MEMRFSRGMVTFAQLCVMATTALACGVWQAGWLGPQGLVVLAGFLAAESVLTSEGFGWSSVHSVLKQLLTRDMRRAWPFYAAVCGIITVQALVGGGLDDWQHYGPYGITFTFNWTRLSDRWTYNPSFSFLWIFSLMLQTVVIATVATTLVRPARRTWMLCGIVIVATAIRLAAGRLFGSLGLSASQIGESILWLTPTQVDAAAFGFLAQCFLKRHRPSAGVACGILACSVAILVWLSLTATFPPFTSYSHIWGVLLVNAAFAGILLSLVSLPFSSVRVTGFAFVVPFVTYCGQQPLQAWLRAGGWTADYASGWAGVVSLTLLTMVAGFVVTLLVRLAPSRRPHVFTGIGAALLAVWSVAYIFRTSFVLDGQRVFTLWDDAMISMTYAKNLANGVGFVWYAGAEAIQGFSNFGVTLLMTLVHLLPVAEFKTSLIIQLVCALGLALTVRTTVRMARLIAPREDYAAGLTVLGFCLLAPINIWSLQGSDVAFVCAGEALILYELMRARSGNTLRSINLVGIAVIGTLCRMDFAIYAFLAGAYLASHRATRREAALVSAAALVTSLGMLCFSRFYYGDWLPNTYYLKASDNLWSEKLHFTLSYFVDSAARLLPLVALSLYAFWRGTDSTRRLMMPPALFAATAVAYNLWLGGDWAIQYESRFLMPAYAPLLAMTVPGLLHLSNDLRAWLRLPQSVLAAAILAIVVLNMTPGPEARKEWFDWNQMTLYRDMNAYNTRVGLFFRRRSAPDTVVGIHWAGIPGYYANRPTVDFLGKCDRFIAKSKGRIYWPGHSKWDWDYIMQTVRPDIITGYSRDLDKRQDFKTDYERMAVDGVDFYVRRGSAGKVFQRNMYE